MPLATALRRHLSAAGPGGDIDPSNNTTQLVIDVLDKNDF